MPKSRPATSQKARTLTVRGLMSIERISQPAVSPDGRSVAFTVSKHDLKENKITQTIRLLHLTTREIQDLTPGPGNHNQAAFSPDGKHLAFASTREEKGGAQLWILPLAGGEARRITSGYGGVQVPHWAPDSRRVAFARSVVVSADYTPGKQEKPDPKTGPARAKVQGLINEKSSARVTDGLLFRHWDVWRDRKRNHLFLADISTGEVVDLTPADVDTPPISLGSERDYDFSPDGREIAYVMNPDAVVTRSTNNSIFVQPLRGIRPNGPATCISTSEACDCHPRYSPDGGRIFYLAMQVPGYEADRRRLKAYHRRTKETAIFLDRFDRSPDHFVLPSGSGPGGLAGVLLLAQDRGRESIYRLDLASGKVVQLTQGTTNGDLRHVPGTGQILVTRETTTEPPDYYLLTPGPGVKVQLQDGPVTGTAPPDAGCAAERLTRFGACLEGIEMKGAEEYWYPGADGHPVHGFLTRPPHFDPKKKYPLILLIHGGPQSAFQDGFHFRWNPQVFAAAGAVVAQPNPRGSTGYGQRFTDQISRDWGGRCYQDLMLGVDYLLEHHPYIDRRRLAAAGASFGGFMINWIAGHTDRFKALVCHDGVFFAETMAYTTDELWFDEYEHGGLPHEERKSYLKYSPHLFVGEFRTPTLVVQGEQDFRCPVSEGIGMFTALQVRGVPSRFLWFPDEGHWVLQPANAEVWYHEVIGWLMKHLG